MGIPGLTTQVYSMDAVWEQDDAKVPLVIDGHALIHFVAHKIPRSSMHSYRKYRAELKNFLELIGPPRIHMILFDGSAPSAKFPTELNRIKQRRSTAHKWMHHVATGTTSHLNLSIADHLIMPFTEEATFDVLQELGVQFQVCWREADQQVGLLAQEANCAVMSRDSDFFLCDLSSGYIPLDRWEMDRTRSRFRFELLVRALDMPKQDVLSLPCYMGNDETPKGRSFDAAMRAIRLRSTPDFPGFHYPRPVETSTHPALGRTAQGEYHPWLIDAELNRVIVPTVQMEDDQNTSWVITQPIRAYAYFLAFFEKEVEACESSGDKNDGNRSPEKSPGPEQTDEEFFQAALSRPKRVAATVNAKRKEKSSPPGLTEIIGGKECAVTPQLEEKFASWVTLPLEPLFVALVRFILPVIDDLSCKALILGFSGVDLQQRSAKVTKKSNRKAKLSRAAVNHYASWQALIASVRLLFHASNVSSLPLKKFWDMDEFFSIRVALLGKRQRLGVKEPEHANSLQQSILKDLMPNWIDLFQQKQQQQQQQQHEEPPPPQGEQVVTVEVCREKKKKKGEQARAIISVEALRSTA